MLWQNTKSLSISLQTASSLLVFSKSFNHRRRRQGGWGAAALPTLEKFAKISHNRAENRPKIGQNFSKQWIFYRAAPLNFISPYAHAFNAFTSIVSTCWFTLCDLLNGLTTIVEFAPSSSFFRFLSLLLLISRNEFSISTEDLALIGAGSLTLLSVSLFDTLSLRNLRLSKYLHFANLPPAAPDLVWCFRLSRHLLRLSFRYFH